MDIKGTAAENNNNNKGNSHGTIASNRGDSSNVVNGHGRVMLLQFASGSLAACGAVTITNPFDLLKTRRQLHNELGQRTSDITRTISLRLVWRAEGIRALQTGLVSAYVYQILMNGTRFMLYEPSRKLLQSELGMGNNSILCNAAAGAWAGGSAALVGSPFNLIKTRLQSYSPHFTTGYQHGYASIREAMAKIYAADGMAGFFRGVQASMLRTTVGSAVQLSSYEWFKDGLVQTLAWSPSHFATHFTSAMGSGVLASIAMNPFDVVMTRLYNQSQGAPLYNGLFDCLNKTVRSEGIPALWKGLVPHFIRVGPHTVLTLVLLEQCRSMLSPFIL